MGYKLNNNIEEIGTKIRSIYNECNNPRNDGYISWGLKQDLYQIKWLVEELLNKTSTFTGEKEWLNEHEKEKVVKILKGQ